MKTAVVLFNLGGPDRPEVVKKFRINLFSDKAIIRAPWFIRVWLSRLIAASSARAAVKNYELMGGKSPLLGHTQSQANALEAVLGPDYRCFIAMRYWHPFARETVADVKKWAPDRVILLPLYPQFSTTTTGSSLTDWRAAVVKSGLVTDVITICCWFDNPAYIAATTSMVRAAIAEAKTKDPDIKLRVLFSAHGLPESIVKKGDPYQAQIEATSKSVAASLQNIDVEFEVCYQSRATPQKWLEPNVVDAIKRAGKEGIGVVVVPIAFVSDHIETLVELDIENRHIAEMSGVSVYVRAAVANDDPAFIEALAAIVRGSEQTGLCHGGSRCGGHKDCPWEKIIAS